MSANQPGMHLSVSNSFQDLGYTVAPDLVSADQLKFLRAAIEVSRQTRRFLQPTRLEQKHASNEYSPIAAEALLRQCRPAIEAITGSELVPTYAFWRIYEHGAALHRHIDRGACEVSASLPIFAQPQTPAWPIHVTDLRGIDTAVGLLPGSAIIYQGCRIPHWREPFAGTVQYQVLLHYVIKGGAMAHLAFDGRDPMPIDRILT